VVTLSIKLTGVDGRRVTFEAAVSEGSDAVARGTHERFIVDVQKVRERLLKKKARRG
jgi:fluoroacetyl-CoA thioesterase